jgi:hypothetical protein
LAGSYVDQKEGTVRLLLERANTGDGQLPVPSTRLAQFSVEFNDFQP